MARSSLGLSPWMDPYVADESRALVPRVHLSVLGLDVSVAEKEHQIPSRGVWVCPLVSVG